MTTAKGLGKQASMRGRLMVALLAAIALPVTLFLSSGTALASNNHTLNYSKAWLFKSKTMPICVQFEVKGNITYTEVVGGGNHGTYYTYSNIQVNDPTLITTVGHLLNGTCSGQVAANKVDMLQAWSGYSCTFNPSISISVPWGISFSGWPSCGTRDQAEYSTSPVAHSYIFTQGNSGNKVHFGDYMASTTDPNAGPCYGVRASGTVYIGNKSDSFTSGADSVCI